MTVKFNHNQALPENITNIHINKLKIVNTKTYIHKLQSSNKYLQDKILGPGGGGKQSLDYETFGISYILYS